MIETRMDIPLLTTQGIMKGQYALTPFSNCRKHHGSQELTGVARPPQSVMFPNQGICHHQVPPERGVQQHMAMEHPQPRIVRG